MGTAREEDKSPPIEGVQDVLATVQEIYGKAECAGEIYYSKLYRDLDGEIRAVNSLEEVYPSVSFLVNRRNQEGKLFAPEQGWSSIWKIENNKVYFGDWKIG